MKKYIWFILLPVLFAFQKKVPDRQSRVCVVKLHRFSSPNQVDTFKLLYNSLEREDTITFQIISSRGELIFLEQFPVYSLFDDETPSYEYFSKKGWKKENYYKDARDSLHKTDSLKIADLQSLQLRVNIFFDNNNFSNDPIPGLYRNYKELLIKGSYEDLMDDQTTIGFTFNLCEENIRGIAFSKKKKKVVVYYRCC